jgi:flagellar hook-length control protein FliK
MYSSDSSVKGMSEMDQCGESQSVNSKQVQGKSLKQGKLGVFGRILEGLVWNTQVGTGSKLAVLGEANGQTSAEMLTSEELGNSGKKNQKKKAIPSGGVTQEGGKPYSGGLQDRNRHGDDNTDIGVLLAVQGEQGLEPPVSQVLLQKKDSPRINKTHLSSAPGSQKETGSPALLVQTKATVQEPGSPGSISKFKADNRETPENTGSEKVNSRRLSRISQPIQTDEQRGVAPVLRQQLGANEEVTQKDLKMLDSKTRDKRRDRIELRDFRFREGMEAASGSLASGDAKPGLETKSLELTVELHADTQDQETAPNSREPSITSSFEDLLARELSQNLNEAIVRQAQVLLRDGGEGTIRLSLRPESLGNVKVHLELAEKKIIGHIIVESNEALRAFEREIHSLEQAFKDSGFGETSLDTALASGSDADPGDSQGREAETGPFFSERFAASTYDAGSEQIGEPGIGMLAAGNGVSSEHIPINMLV